MNPVDLTARLRSAEQRARELEAEAAALLTGLTPAATPHRLVEARFDDRGLLETLDYTGERSVDSVTLQGEIMLALVGRGFPIAEGPERMVALADALLGTEPREAVRRNERGDASVTAREGLVVRVAFDHRALRGARSQTLCDEVVPLARAAAAASDSLGRFGGGVR